MRRWTMALAATAGLFGAAGVALAAAGAHRTASPLATTAAYFLLFHAAAILGLCGTARPDRGVTVAASLMAAGALLFCGELAVHALAGLQPLPIAAPVGGLLMIGGWLTAGSLFRWHSGGTTDTSATLARGLTNKTFRPSSWARLCATEGARLVRASSGQRST